MRAARDESRGLSDEIERQHTETSSLYERRHFPFGGRGGDPRRKARVQRGVWQEEPSTKRDDGPRLETGGEHIQLQEIHIGMEMKKHMEQLIEMKDKLLECLKMLVLK